MSTPRAWYNENDPKAAAWLRELIKHGHIADGDVDERSIEDVYPDDLKPYTQCHFFAGIGGWSLALRLVGIPDHARVWTGSCPCQPFSAAGKGGGFADERHLWPAFFHHIEVGRPERVYGEQVASKDGLAWLDLVRADLEGTGYAVGAQDICSAGIGAADIRQRLYWLAVSDGGDSSTKREQRSGKQRQFTAHSGTFDGVAHAYDGSEHALLRARANHTTENVRGGASDGSRRRVAGGDESESCGLADTKSGRTVASQQSRRLCGVECGGAAAVNRLEHAPRDGRQQRGTEPSRRGAPSGCGDDRPGPLHGFWRNADWLYGRDGKWRPVEAGTFPLAHGLPDRVGLLRGYGNAINPHVAAAFIAESW